MKVVNVVDSKQKKKYVDFIYKLYKNDLCFKDTLVGIVKTFLNQSDTFTKECYVKPIYVEENNEILAQCILIHNHKLPIFQVGFFEAKEGVSKAVYSLINTAIKEANKLDLKKIVIGLNGHVSYGVGILMDNFDKPIPFDSLYHKSYYVDYFDKYKFKKLTLTTYFYYTNQIKFNERILEKVNKEFTFRYLDKKNFKNEMILFGNLCNQTLKETPLYFPREGICMYELLKDLGPFLDKENLIFALKDGKEVGFIFWHPDFNEIIPGGKKNTMLSLGFNFFFKRRKVNKMIINAIGILEPYQRSLVAYGLLNECYKVASKKFESGVTNFVFDNNEDSTLLNKSNTVREDRHYCVYLLDL